MLTFKPSKLEEKVNKFLFFGKARRRIHDYLREKLGYIGKFISQDAVSDAYGVLAMMELELMTLNKDYILNQMVVQLMILIIYPLTQLLTSLLHSGNF